tara:strand:+ start:369 stop:917 length:549 start_codon:yes stop_codon:yes gene_type:complete
MVYREISHHHNDDMSEVSEKVTILPLESRTYIVVITYFKNDETNQLDGGNFAQMEGEELVASRYKVNATSCENAIHQAMKIDKARRMEVITGYIQPFLDRMERGEEDLTPNMLESFRHYMLEGGHFVEFYMQEPTSIQTYLQNNESMIHNKTITNVFDMSDAKDMTEDIEDFLKKEGEQENE